MDIAVGPVLFLLAASAVSYLWLSLTDRRSITVRVWQGLAAGLFGLALVLTATSVGRGVRSGVTVRSGDIDAEAAVQPAGRAVGGWLALLGVGELLRVGLKRRAGVELLDPFALLLAGVLLFSPHWSVGVALAVVLLALVGLHIWGPRAAAPPPASDAGP
ncbi:MAG: hypothetical protein K2X87_24900 [Gemmataceae bacterium]|nr:hypothetical protein [Gemmataceae bacterium]